MSVNLSKGSIPKKNLPHEEKKFSKKLLIKAVVASKNLNFVSTVAFGFFVQFA